MTSEALTSGRLAAKQDRSAKFVLAADVPMVDLLHLPAKLIVRKPRLGSAAALREVLHEWPRC
jgi:hypothetical protein